MLFFQEGSTFSEGGAFFFNEGSAFFRRVVLFSRG